jgi:multiple sugar transport system substrate-binding protein
MTLRGCTWDHPRGLDPLVATAAAYGDAEIAWEARSLQAFGDASVAELAEKYDLIVIDHPHVGIAAGEGALLPLDQWIDAKTMSALAEQTVGPCHASYSWEDHQWALAIDAACQVSAYLPGALASSPRNWEGVIEVAKNGGVVWPLKPADAFASFCTILLGIQIFAADGDEFVSLESGLIALALMEEVARHVPDWCLDSNPIDALETISRGEAIYCPLLYGYSNYARPGFRERVVCFADSPGELGSILGGAGLAVSSKSRDPEIAVAYATWVASPEIQSDIYFLSGGQPASAGAWDDPVINNDCSHFFRDTRATMDNAWVRPRHAGFVEANYRIGEEINSFLRNPAQPEGTVAAINHRYAKSLSR